MSVIRKTIPFVLLAALVLSGCAGSAPERTLAVTGTGSVKLAPDLAVVTTDFERDFAQRGVLTQGTAYRLKTK